jgi:2'-5' RNA ligase
MYTRKRLFFAIPLTQEIIEQIISFERSLKNNSIIWVPAENLHITLLFLGTLECSCVSLNFLHELFERVLKNINSFVLSFENITYAPPGGPARMIWATFCEELVSQDNKSDKKKTSTFESLVLQPCECVNVFLEAHSRDKNNNKISCNNKIIPHVTLSRLKGREILEHKLPQPQIFDLMVSEICLMESQLLPHGPQYTVLKKYFIEE